MTNAVGIVLSVDDNLVVVVVAAVGDDVVGRLGGGASVTVRFKAKE
jgi:hypothetical protein